MKRYTHKEWLEEGKKRFGNDRAEWKFVCPNCGRIQSVKEFMDIGNNPNDAMQECIGRYKPELHCDWTSYGLFGTCGKGVEVELSDGKIAESFAFADVEEKDDKL